MEKTNDTWYQNYLKDILFHFSWQAYVWPLSSYNCEVKLLMILWGIKGDKNYILIDILKIVFSLIFGFGLGFFVVSFFFPLNMRHALGKIVCAKIGQRTTLIKPSKWNSLLPTLLQLWRLDHVILLVFYIFFFFLLAHFIDYILLKITPLHQLLHGEWFGWQFYFCNSFFIKASTAWHRRSGNDHFPPVTLLQGLFWVRIVVVQVKKLIPWGWGFLATSI